MSISISLFNLNIFTVNLNIFTNNSKTMIKTKPVIGILPTPNIRDDASVKLFTETEIITFLNEQNIDHIIIPYTIKKVDLNKILYNLDGLIFPQNHPGNYSNNKYIKQHFLAQKYIVAKVKLLAKKKVLIPILSICHSFQSMILIENKYNFTNKNIKKTFINVNSLSNETLPKFKNTKLGNLFKSNFNKTMKLFHNHTLGLDSKYKIKNYEVIATSLDKNNKEFIDIVKHKKYPFFGFQGHPEVKNTQLMTPYISYVNNIFNKKKIYKTHFM